MRRVVPDSGPHTLAGRRWCVPVSRSAVIAGKSLSTGTPDDTS
jgi:hypothetical protein